MAEASGLGERVALQPLRGDARSVAELMGQWLPCLQGRGSAASPPRAGRWNEEVAAATEELKRTRKALADVQADLLTLVGWA